MPFIQVASLLLLLLGGITYTNAQFRAPLYTRLPKCGEDQCFCTGEDSCPPLPSISQETFTHYGTVKHVNPMNIQCDPIAAPSCVTGLQSGEACVVEMIAPEGSTDPCPSGWSYRLETVPSLEEALMAGKMVTHTGPCGTCSSLQDLRTMLNTRELPMKGNNCFWRSSALGDENIARNCFKDLGFTDNCARTLVSFQRRINSRCDSLCAAFALGEGQDSPSCVSSPLCARCGTEINQRFEVVAGRTDINSGLPAWTAVDCAQIASPEVVYHGELCQVSIVEPPVASPVRPPTTPPTKVVTKQPTTKQPTRPPTKQPSPSTSAPTNKAPTTKQPTKQPTKAPTKQPTKAPTIAPTNGISAGTNSALSKCQEISAIEISLSGRAGGSVVCDCSNAENGKAIFPTCYISPDRGEENLCSVQFGSCQDTSDCCNAGVRSCRGGQCRSASRTSVKNQLRIGATMGGASRGGEGGSAGATNSIRAPLTRGDNRERRRIRGDSTRYSNHRKSAEELEEH